MADNTPASSAKTPPPPLPYDSKLDVVGYYHPPIDRPDPSLRIQQPSAADHQAARKTLLMQLAQVHVDIAQYDNI